MAIPARGVREIRTLSGKVHQVALPYRVYMGITCLEMEKFRRGSERKSASRRVADIDARLREIEAEKTALLQSVGEGARRTSEGTRGAEPISARSQSKGGFKIRY